MSVHEFLVAPASGQASAAPGDTAHFSAHDHTRGDPDTKRLAWLDAAKGVGIILVVYGHQLRAQITTGKIDPSWYASMQDAMIYAFHMPLFFFISGLTIERSFRKTTAWLFVRSRLTTLMYPYILWSLISLGLAMAGQRYVNHEINLGDMAAIAWKPVFQYWFLYALFLCQIVAFCVRMRHAIIALIAIAALLSPFGMPYPIAVETIASFPFFAAGILLSPRLKTLTDYSSKKITAFGVASTIAFLVLFFCRDGIVPGSPIFQFGLAGCGIATVVALSVAIGARSRLLTLLGATSMVIFVLHTIVATAIRSGLHVISRFDTNAVELLCCVVGGLVIPVLIHRIVSRFGLARLLGLGASREHRAA